TKDVQTSAKLLEGFSGMSPQVDTRDITAVRREVQSIYKLMFASVDEEFIERVFGWVQDCFQGRYPGYLPIDAGYHDLEHTLQGTLCMVRILGGRHRAQAQPLCSSRLFELGLLAILLHDSGYLKRAGDTQGTGAKYTLTHVGRGMDFAAQLLQDRLFADSEIKAVRNMISCTGGETDPGSIPFQSEMEKVAGFALGTGDLLGQMAASDYVEKLPMLFEEFAEAQRFSTPQSDSRIAFSDAHDLMAKTSEFWEQYVKPRIEHDFAGLYRFLNNPYPAGPNPYLERIEANLWRLRQQLAAASNRALTN
ncbi:MAG: hypothetical protein L0Z50_23425, partial [Verrucomicrobiales bacterium]|nr:hypothetical protein [Verrucomicrobiales bacterium]